MSEPRRSVAGIFARAWSAERTLRALIGGEADLSAISLIVRDEQPGADPSDDREGDAEALLTLALDGDLGRRVGAGVLTVGYPAAIVIVGALATRLRAASRGLADPMGGALSAAGVPWSAIPPYLAAIEAGRVLLMVEAATTACEMRIRHAFARYGAVEIRSYPVLLPSHRPATRTGLPAPSRAATDVATDITSRARLGFTVVEVPEVRVE